METPLLVIQAEYNRYNSSRCELFPDRVVLSTRCTGGRWPVYRNTTREIPISDIERVEISVGGTGFFAHHPNAVHFITGRSNFDLDTIYRNRGFSSTFYIDEGVQQFCAASAADLAEKVGVASRMKAYIDEFIRRAQLEQVVERERRNAEDIPKWLRISPPPRREGPNEALDDAGTDDGPDAASPPADAGWKGIPLDPEAYRTLIRRKPWTIIGPENDGADPAADGESISSASPADGGVENEAGIPEQISAESSAPPPAALSASAKREIMKYVFMHRTPLGARLLNHFALPLLALLLGLAFGLRPDVRSAPVPYLISLANLAAARLPMALGAAGCIIVAGPDLSGGRVMGLTAFFSAVLLQKADVAGRFLPGGEPLPVWAALLAALGVGALIGLANGLLVGKGKGHPLVVTLASQFIVYGVYLELSGSRQIASLDNSYTLDFLTLPLFRAGSATVPMYAALAVIIASLMGVVWAATGLGEGMYLVGGDQKGARDAGVSAPLTIVLTFMLAGALYGFGGFVECARIGVSNPSLGLGCEFEALAAAVLGGVTLAGGRGSVGGVILGTLAVAAAAEALAFLGVTGLAAYAAKGALVLMACLLDSWRYRGKQ